MTNAEPKVSVIIPSYIDSIIFNAVQSVIEQDYKNTELIIINDGSDEESYYNYQFPNNVKIYTSKKIKIFMALDQDQ